MSIDKQCVELINSLVNGFLQAETRRLEDLGLGLVLNLIKEQLSKAGMDFDVEDLTDLKNLIYTAPELVLAHFEYDGDIVAAFLSQLNTNKTITGLALLYVSGVELKAALASYRQSLSDLLEALRKWELEVKKQGEVEEAMKALSVAKDALKSSYIAINEAIMEDDFQMSTRYLERAEAYVRMAEQAICATPRSETLPSLKIYSELWLAYSNAQLAFSVAAQKNRTFMKFVDEYANYIFSESVSIAINRGFQLGQQAMRPVIAALRKAILNLMKQRVLTCIQLKALRVSLESISPTKTTAASIQLNKEMKLATAQLNESFSAMQREKTHFEFDQNKFEEGAGNFKKREISSELLSVIRLESTLDALLSNSVFKYGDVLKTIDFFSSYLEILKNMNMQNLFDYVPQLLQRIDSSTNIYDAIQAWQTEIGQAIEAMHTLDNPFFSVDTLKEVLSCVEKPSPAKTLTGMQEIGQEVIKAAAELTAHFVRLYDAFRASVVKTFEKFNVSLPKITSMLRKIEDYNRKTEALNEYAEALNKVEN